MHRFVGEKPCTLASPPHMIDDRSRHRLTRDAWVTVGGRLSNINGGPEMTSLKTRLHNPLLITVVTVLASTGAAFRIN